MPNSTSWVPPDIEAWHEAYRNGATQLQLQKIGGPNATINRVVKYICQEQRAGRLAPRRPRSAQPLSAPSNYHLKRYTDYLKLTGDFAIAGDWHLPFYNCLWADRLLGVSRKQRVTRLIVAGDGLDMHAFSGWGGDPELPWTEEAQAACGMVWTLYHSYERIYWLRGNHEDRIARKTDWQLTYPDLLHSLLIRYADANGYKFAYDPDKLTTSIYPQCEIDGAWRVIHPKSYSKTILSVANQLALKYAQHVILAHCHHASAGWAYDGKHVVMESGGIFDPELVSYTNLSVTTHPEWQPGFVIYRNGTARLYANEPYTDWEEAL